MKNRPSEAIGFGPYWWRLTALAGPGPPHHRTFSGARTSRSPELYELLASAYWCVQLPAPSIPHHEVALGTDAMFPHQVARIKTQAVKETIVGSQVDPAVVDGRREANRSFGEKRPSHIAGFDIQGVEFAVGAGAVQQQPGSGYHLISVIERLTMQLAQRLRPGRHGGVRRVMRPLQVQRIGQPHRSCGAAAVVIMMRRPVGF